MPATTKSSAEAKKGTSPQPKRSNGKSRKGQAASNGKAKGGNQRVKAQAKTAATPERTIDVKALVVGYLEAKGSSDPTAPEKGLPFVQNGRVYLQLQGRVTGGLLEHARKALKDKELPKGELLKAILAFGFARRPFSYQHPDRGQTSASYYSVEAGKVGKLDGVEARKAPERQPKGDGARANIAALLKKPLPMKPDGSPQDVRKLRRLWSAFDAARAAVKTGSTPEAREQVRAAQRELIDHRAHMVRKTGADLSEYNIPKGMTPAAA